MQGGEAIGHSVPGYDACVITTIHKDFDKRVFRQICALVDAGLKVCVIAPWDFAHRPRGDFDFIQLDYPKSRLRRPFHGWRVYRAAKSVTAAVYIFHDPDFLPYATALQRFGSKTVVYDAHENVPEDIQYGKAWIPSTLRRPISGLFRIVENILTKRLGFCIAAVESIQRRFSALGVKTVMVRNFPRLAVPDGFTNERGVLYTGGLTADYGAHTILDIAAELKRRGVDIPFRVVDVFYGDDEYRNWFLSQIWDRKLGIELLAPVPAHKMPDILGRGSIGLSPITNLPNKALALPTKIFEYYQFGLVVISSDVAGSRFATGDGKYGILVPHDDPAQWADRIELLLKETSYFEQYQTAGRLAVEREFNWEQEERKLVAFVQEFGRSSAAKNLTV